MRQTDDGGGPVKRIGLLVWLLPSLAFAVDGTVINGTTGKPQSGVEITYMSFGDAGMQPAGAAKTDSSGRFKIDASVSGPSMLQASYGGVTYNQMLRPGAATSGVKMQVYESSANPPEAKVAQHMVLFEPADRLTVNETIIYENTGNVTKRDPDGATFRFYLPPEAGGVVRVRVSTPNGMPTDRAARETGEKNVFGVDYPIRPGETRFDLAYELPSASKFGSRVLHDGVTRLVAPRGVTLASPDLETLGQEPSTQATVYGLKSKNYDIEIAGTGTLNAGGASQPSEEETALQQSHPRIYQRLYWILGLTLLILTFGLILLYRSGERRA
jgi:hypothetical protein